MKPTLILVGADKGGVGKTTVSRALLDFLTRHNVPARVFDTEHPRGSLHRFFPTISEIIDLSDVASQMRLLDTLETGDTNVTVVDLKAGNLSLALGIFEHIGVLRAARDGLFNLGLIHVVGPSVASLEEIAEVAPFIDGHAYVIARNFINDTNFFEWDAKTYNRYFGNLSKANEIDVPKLNEMAYEQVDLAGVTFNSFIANKTASLQPANFSFVLRGYVNKWSADLEREFQRLDLIRSVLASAKEAASAPVSVKKPVPERDHAAAE